MTCKRCGSDKVMTHVPLQDGYGDTGALKRPLEVHVHGDPDAWVFKDTVTGNVVANICGACGYTELETTNFRELYKKYRQARRG
jgi:hypothetical protein